PHVWFDVRLWMLVTERIRDSLIEADGQNAETYRANAADYLAELRGLEAEIRARFEKIPPEQRVLITAHDAFGYFGRAYNFEVRGLQGISTSAEASAADVQELARLIAERKIAAVFVETSVPQRTIEAVQAAVRSRGFETSVGGSLYSDAMGDAGTPEGTYVGMVRRNADTIFNALAGANASVPDR
ncbi:MAG TPA: zinc ABC transporter substrate-binding protein, partial [Pyrinomonadaceae bacterium]|nr:zinc ABC transporter substrate-binding protein [Pyrinomonadaceae bacterium]